MKFVFTFLLLFSAVLVGAQSTNTITNSEKSLELEKGNAPVQNAGPVQLEEIQIQSVNKASKKEAKGSANESERIDAMRDSKIEQEQNFKNLFLVQNNLSRTQLNSRSPSPNQQTQMESVLAFYEKTAPNSFEFHFFTYLAGNYNVNLINHLKAAERMNPDNEAVLVQLVSYAEIVDNKEETKFYLEKLKKSGKLKTATIDYARNLLASVLENGVVLTHGFDDEMGCRYVQLIENKHTDIQVISFDFLQSEFYKNRIGVSGFKLPTNQLIDIAYLKAFCQSNPMKNIQLSMTFPKEYLKEISVRLQVLGLTFLYKSDPVSTFTENETLWNTTFGTEFEKQANNTSTKELLNNYLPMLLYLRETYLANEVKDKVLEIDKAIDLIALKTGNYEKINSLRKGK